MNPVLTSSSRNGAAARPAGSPGPVTSIGADAISTVLARYPTAYTWYYDVVRRELRDLYEKAKEHQWNGARDLPWDTRIDPEVTFLPDEHIPIFGTDIWNRMTEAERVTLRRHSASWLLSQFLHGEQGALLATAQVVGAAPTNDAKLCASAQVMDEARHVEVYERYLREKLELSYGCNAHLRGLLDTILTDGRWDMKYLGMQIMVEGLALAAFGLIHAVTTEPLILALTRGVMRDEARHVAFGVLGLREHYADMREAERREREEFVYEAAVLMRDRFLMEEVWEAVGLPVKQCTEHALQSQDMVIFRRLLFSKIVPNVKRLGLLSPWLRERFRELDILEYEDWDVAMDEVAACEPMLATGTDTSRP
jgi:hypothetical protein